MFAWWQILLLTLYSAYQIMDELGPYSSAGQAVFAGLVSGLIMGDMVTGLYIGGSMQLMVLGVGTFGGASRVDANSGTVVATAFAVGAGMQPEQALAAIGVPVAALLVYTDILARFANADVEKMNWGAFNVHYLLGGVSWMLSRCLPIFLALVFGQGLVEVVVNALNSDFAWLAKGLTVAGGALPAVGFAILLRYLPVKKHAPYLLLGFTIAALFSTVFTSIKVVASDVATIGASDAVASVLANAGVTLSGGTFNTLSMLTIALIGLALSLIYYRNNQQAPAIAAASSVEEDDDDEL